MSGERVCVGAIAGAFGVRGEVRLKSFCAEPEAIATYGPLWTQEGREFTVSLGRPIAGGIAARLSGVDTREAADAFPTPPYALVVVDATLNRRVTASRGRPPRAGDADIRNSSAARATVCG